MNTSEPCESATKMVFAVSENARETYHKCLGRIRVFSKNIGVACRT